MLISSTPLLRLLTFQLLIVSSLHAQHPKGFPHSTKLSNHAQQRPNDPILPESNCSNGVDDNGNGLTDTSESHCYFYFDSIYHDCRPTSILWACSSLGIHWVNLATNEERLVAPPPDNDFFVDIAWGPDGKLYAAGDSRKIFEIDPLSWSVTPIDLIYGYQPNGLTADGTGMLYLTAFTNDLQTCDLLKFNPVTHQSELIVRLSDYDLMASGDCCFLNGFLYVTCDGYIARVDINTKLVEKLRVDNIFIDHSWGITTLGDGYLYISDNGRNIYRLDPATMKETLIFRFNQPDMFTSGFASYVDACNAPCAKPRVSLGHDTVVCVNNTLLLNAQADRTVSSYLWSNGVTQKTNAITSPGTYWIKVSNSCDTNSDTVVVGSAVKPLAALRNDTLICTFTSIVLNNLEATQQGDRFLWPDNSDRSTFTVRTPGTYWLQMSNVCGSVADTVQIFPKTDSCECFVYIPNAFSPNDDHLNDLFHVSSNCILKGSVQIFNRWGKSVYRSENLDAGWNGLMVGKAQPQGIYVYMLRFSYLDHPGTFTRKGTVMLLR